MSRREETHGVQFELVRHFLRRMFDGEWSSSPGQWRSAAIGVFSMFLPAGLLLVREGAMDPKYAFKYHLLPMAGIRAAALADEIALLTLMLCVTGLIALLEWQSLFPSGRDYLALASLPIRSRQIFAARFTSVLLFSAVLIAAMNFLPSLLAPLEFGGGWRLDASYWTHVGAQALSSGLACFFVFFAILALQGVLLNVLPARLFARGSVYVQGALVGSDFDFVAIVRNYRELVGEVLGIQGGPHVGVRKNRIRAVRLVDRFQQQPALNEAVRLRRFGARRRRFKLRAMHSQSAFSSERPGHEAVYAIDDSNGTVWQPAETDAQPTLTLDLVAPTEFETNQFFVIDSARIEFAAGRGGGFGARGAAPEPGAAAAASGGVTAFRYKVEASLDGKEYATVLDKTKNDGTLYTAFDEIPPTRCRFVRLTITDWPRRGTTLLGITEFTVFGKAAPAQMR